MDLYGKKSFLFYSQSECSFPDQPIKMALPQIDQEAVDLGSWEARTRFAVVIWRRWPSVVFYLWHSEWNSGKDKSTHISKFYKDRSECRGVDCNIPPVRNTGCSAKISKIRENIFAIRGPSLFQKKFRCLYTWILTFRRAEKIWKNNLCIHCWWNCKHCTCVRYCTKFSKSPQSLLLILMG